MAFAGRIHGVAVSPGLALGPVQIVRAESGAVPTWTVAAADLEREVGRLRRALETASEELLRRQRIVAAQASEKEAQIFAVHRAILADPSALREVEDRIRGERINAEAAVSELIRRVESTFSKIEGESVRSYAADLADPWREVMHALLLGERDLRPAEGDKVVLAAAVLTAKVLTSVERHRLCAVITEAGGRFSHGAVLARAFGIPCVTALPGVLARLEQGMVVAVDGDRGTLQLRPDPAQIAEFQERLARLEARRAALSGQASLPARTSDGATLKVLVNLESLNDLDMFEAAHTDGVGLLRTEFLYMERPHFPSEDEQFRMYRRLVEWIGTKPVTLRTLDIGGDKRLPYFKTPSEANPALGWRGLRVSLEWQDLLRVQLRAALRAGVGADLRILLPMVGSLEDVLAVHAIFDGVRTSLAEHGFEVDRDYPVGIMIEVPSAVVCLEDLIRHVDFVSVGTNDLVQYLLAVDRDNPWVSKLYEPQHPAVMRSLAEVARVARAAGKSCSVCGDMADDPAIAILLLGLGYESVSVAPNFLPEIKYAVRKCTHAEARSLAADVLSQSTVEGVRRTLSKFRDRLHSA